MCRINLYGWSRINIVVKPIYKVPFSIYILIINENKDCFQMLFFVHIKVINEQLRIYDEEKNENKS